MGSLSHLTDHSRQVVPGFVIIVFDRTAIPPNRRKDALARSDQLLGIPDRVVLGRLLEADTHPQGAPHRVVIDDDIPDVLTRMFRDAEVLVSRLIE
jgi:hypothetical protein